jgi:hypothetical protein
MLTRRHLKYTVSGLLGLIISGIGLRGSPLGFVLLLGGLVGGAWMAAGLLAPWLGARTQYRLLYHTPDWSPEAGVTLGRGLDTIARATERGLVLIWRREAGQLTLALDIPAVSASALERLLGHLLPDLVLEPVPPQTIPTGLSVARWPLPTAGQGGVADPYDATAWLEPASGNEDLEVRTHLVAGGGAVVRIGLPAAAARAAGLQPLWSLLWSRLGRYERAFRCCLLVEPWPGNGVPIFRLPPSGTPGMERLDTHTSLHIPLPLSYCFPSAVTSALVLGVATADGRPLGLPVGCMQPGQPEWGGHFAVLGADQRACSTTVGGLISQALAAGIAVLHLDSTGESGRELAAHPSIAGRVPILWSDLENPGGSLHLNLLAPPTSTGDGSPATIAATLLLVLEAHLPVLGEYLRWLGVSGERGAGDDNLMLDWARVLVLRHYRALLSGGPPPAPLPDLPLLYAALATPETLASLLWHEERAWLLPDSALAHNLDAAGVAGQQARALAQATLATLNARRLAQPASVLRLQAATLRTRLAPALEHTALRHLWQGTTQAPAAVFERTPGPLLLTRLPARKGPAADVAAARWYGYYLLAAVIAVARARVRRHRAGPPLLVVLDDMRVWGGSGFVSGALDVLGQAGVAVLMVSAGLPATPDPLRWLDRARTCWISSLDGGDVGLIRDLLQARGVTADLPLGALPPDVSLVSAVTAAMPITATVYTDLARITRARATGVPARPDRSGAVAMVSPPG